MGSSSKIYYIFILVFLLVTLIIVIFNFREEIKNLPTYFDLPISINETTFKIIDKYKYNINYFGNTGCLMTVRYMINTIQHDYLIGSYESCIKLPNDTIKGYYDVNDFNNISLSLTPSSYYTLTLTALSLVGCLFVLIFFTLSYRICCIKTNNSYETLK